MSVVDWLLRTPHRRIGFDADAYVIPVIYYSFSRQFCTTAHACENQAAADMAYDKTNHIFQFARRYSHVNWMPQMRSFPIWPRHSRSAVRLTFGISPSLIVREPFGHFSLMIRSASRRPADESMSPSECTDHVATPPVDVSRVNEASCPHP